MTIDQFKKTIEEGRMQYIKKTGNIPTHCFLGTKEWEAFELFVGNLTRRIPAPSLRDGFQMSGITFWKAPTSSAFMLSVKSPAQMMTPTIQLHGAN